MSDKKELASVWVVTDCDTGMYRVGEVDGGFNMGLRDHIVKYGSDDLLRKLSYMISDVVSVQQNINSEASGQYATESSAGAG